MAGSLSNYAENKILAHSVGKESWTMPSAVYIALYTTAPNENTNGTEVQETINGVSSNYARRSTSATSWTIPTNGNISNAVTFEFGPASIAWGNIDGVAVLDAQNGGNVIWYGTFSSPRTILAGEKLVFDIGSFLLTLN